MDLDNPAVAALVTMPPALLEELAQNPKARKDHFTKLMLVQTDVFHMRLKDPNIPLTQRLAFMEFLAKVADVLPKPQAANASAAAPVAVLNINFRGKKKDLPFVEVVREGQAEEGATSDTAPQIDG